ncbi:MAG TPA: hypothetical protein VLI54_00625 [Bacillota bacterium]|nr:hypothetical protein [Bacillota bacterium]
MRKPQGGYVALMTVLIVGAAAAAVSTVLLVVGADSARYTLGEQQSRQARSLALACGQEALQVLHDNVAFTGTDVPLTLGQGNCTYTVTVADGTNRIISAVGTVGSQIRKVQATATIGATTMTVSSWRDAGDRYKAITHLQGASMSDVGAVTSLVQAFSANVTAGSLIVAAASWDNSTTSTMTCTDNRGNTYTGMTVWINAVDNQTLAICYAPNAAAGSTTVTATLGAGANFRRFVISEYSGVATSSPVDVSAGVQGITATTTTDAVTAGSVTTTQNGDLIYGAVMDTTGNTGILPGTGFTGRSFANTKDLLVEDKQQAIAGSVSAPFTFPAANKYNAVVIAFKAALQ